MKQQHKTPAKHPVNDNRGLTKEICGLYDSLNDQTGKPFPRRIKLRMIARMYKMDASEIRQIVEYENHLANGL